MSKKLRYLIGVVLLLTLMPIRSISQTSGDAKADKVERAHRTHVVKKAWNGTKRDVSTAAKATAHATKKVWHGTKRDVKTAANATAHATTKVWHGAKRDVSNGARATGRVTRKAWRGTKRGVTTAVRAPGKAIHHAKVKHQQHEKQEGETN